MVPIQSLWKVEKNILYQGVDIDTSGLLVILNLTWAEKKEGNDCLRPFLEPLVLLFCCYSCFLLEVRDVADCYLRVDARDLSKCCEKQDNYVKKGGYHLFKWLYKSRFKISMSTNQPPALLLGANDMRTVSLSEGVRRPTLPSARRVVFGMTIKYIRWCNCTLNRLPASPLHVALNILNTSSSNSATCPVGWRHLE